MFVCISARQYCQRGTYGDLELNPMLDKWLDDRKVWQGLDGDWGTVCPDHDLRPLQTWVHLDGYHWTAFKWNNHKIALEFKNHFTDWNASHRHRVIVWGVRYNASSIGGSDVGRWLKGHDLTNSSDYSYGPHIDQSSSEYATAFEFRDPRIATMFKLTFGGAGV